MPSNYTPNYQLNQWERSDKVLMEDFNADNAKIDTALKSLAGLISGHTTTLSKKGNCQIYTQSYTGTGTYGETTPTVIRFPKNPVLVLVCDTDRGCEPMIPNLTEEIDFHIVNNGHYYGYVKWTEDSFSIYSKSAAVYQLNSNRLDYLVLAFYKADEE